MRLTLAIPYLAISASKASMIAGGVLSASISTANFFWLFSCCIHISLVQSSGLYFSSIVCSFPPPRKRGRSLRSVDSARVFLNRIGDLYKLSRNSFANRQGEGRCPVVPLVFKTSLGIVRFPEGSTPSLLRQESYDKSSGYSLQRWWPVYSPKFTRGVQNHGDRKSTRLNSS